MPRTAVPSTPLQQSATAAQLLLALAGLRQLFRQTFTGVATGAALALGPGGASRYALSVAETGSFTDWIVHAQVSPDGENGWTTVLTHQKTVDLDDTTVFVVDKPAGYVRFDCPTYTPGGATQIDALLLALN